MSQARKGIRNVQARTNGESDLDPDSGSWNILVSLVVVLLGVAIVLFGGAQSYEDIFGVFSTKVHSDNHDQVSDTLALEISTYHWIPKGSVLFGPHPRSRFGFSLDMLDGDLLVVGIPGYQNNTGAIQVFLWSEPLQNWTLFGPMLLGTHEKQDFGRSVSLSTDQNEDGIKVAAAGLGRAALYQLEVQGQEDLRWQPAEPDKVKESTQGFGFRISHRKNLVVTAPGEGGGVVESYSRGKLLTRLERYKPGDHAGVGLSVSLDGSTVAVGAPMYSQSPTFEKVGMVRVFRQVLGDESGEQEWVQIGQELVGKNSNDWFGQAVAVSGNGKIFAVGAPGYDDAKGDDCGLVKVFCLTQGRWRQFGPEIIGEAPGSEMGFSLSLSEDGKVSTHMNPSAEFLKYHSADALGCL